MNSSVSLRYQTFGDARVVHVTGRRSGPLDSGSEPGLSPRPEPTVKRLAGLSRCTFVADSTAYAKAANSEVVSERET